MANETLSPGCVDKLLERTKRKGRRMALETPLAEAEASAKKDGDDGSRMRKPSDSPIDNDTHRRCHSGPPIG